MNATLPGKLIVISGPSGAGKSTVVKELLKQCTLPLVLSISATTRQRREGERDGTNYFFLTKEEFAHCRERGEFLECKEVFGRGDWYGTFRSQVTTGLEAGKWVILEIDVEGALAVLQEHPDVITLFLHPGSLDELERRLRSRGTDREEAIVRRLEVARREMTFLDRYRHNVINDSIDRAVQEICQLLQSYT